MNITRFQNRKICFNSSSKAPVSESFFLDSTNSEKCPRNMTCKLFGKMQEQVDPHFSEDFGWVVLNFTHAHFVSNSTQPETWWNLKLNYFKRMSVCVKWDEQRAGTNSGNVWRERKKIKTKWKRVRLFENYNHKWKKSSRNLIPQTLY